MPLPEYKKQIEKEEVEHEETVFIDLEKSPAFIFDATHTFEKIPKGYNAVKIPLDGRIEADLSWKGVREIAQSYIAQSLRIFWEIDLGLFDRLSSPLNQQRQYLSLSLSLDHFYNTLWKEFALHSVGLCLYRGSLDFTQQISVDETLLTEKNKLLACRDIAAEYLQLLATHLPDDVPCFVLLNASNLENPLLIAELLSKESFSRIYLGVQKGRCFGGELGWEGNCLKFGLISRSVIPQLEIVVPSIGVCLPTVIKTEHVLENIFIQLESAQLNFKVIPESMLTIEWDRLDYLIVSSEDLSFQGKRKLQGFCAAGGCVVTKGALIGLANEIEMGHKIEFFRNFS